MLGSMNGRHGGVYVQYVSLTVSCHWMIHHCMIVKDNGKGQVTRRNLSFSWESVFKMLKNNICNTEFEVGQAFRKLRRYISKTHWNISYSNMLEGKSTPNIITN